MLKSAVTSKGQTTPPKSVRQAPGVKAGNRLRYGISDNRNSPPAGPTVNRLFGSLKYDDSHVKMKDMEQAGAK